MIFGPGVVDSPFFWIFFAGLFAGASAARATRPSERVDKWVLACLYLSAGAALGLAAVFVPGPAKIQDPELGYFAAAVALAGFLGNRHKLTLGVPIFLAGCLIVAAFAVSLVGWSGFPGTTAAIGEIQVFSVSDDSVGLQVAGRPPQPVAGSTGAHLEGPPTLGGEALVSGALPYGPISAHVSLLRFDPSYFFLSAPGVFRFLGVVAAERLGVENVDDSGARGASGPTTGDSISLASGGGGRTPWVARLPGVSALSVTSNPVVPSLLARYEVRFDPRRLSASLVPAESLSD